MRARLAATPFCCGLHTFCSAIHFRRWFSSVAGCHPFLCKNFSAMLTALEPAGKHTRAWVDGSCMAPQHLCILGFIRNPPQQDRAFSGPRWRLTSCCRRELVKVAIACVLWQASTRSMPGLSCVQRVSCASSPWRRRHRTSRVTSRTTPRATTAASLSQSTLVQTQVVVRPRHWSRP